MNARTSRLADRSVALPAIALSLLAGAGRAHADRLVTTDGRVLEVIKARANPDGSYTLRFESGEIVCPASVIASVEVEGDMSDYVPQNDDEREKLEQGYVRFEGKWLSKPAYETELKRRAEEARERTDFLAEHADFRNPWSQETKHFVFQSNTSPEILEGYAELIEAYYDLMDSRIGIKPTPTMKRTKPVVRIYKSREDFHDWNPELSPGVAGYFSRLDHTLNFYHDYAEPELTQWVALHECTHLLTYLIDQDYLPQIWINEAVADYYGSATIERDKKGRLRIEPGKMQTDRILTVQQAIRDGNSIPLAELFLIDNSSFEAFQYAHAWSFVYFLCSEEKTRKAFERFFRDLYTLDLSAKAETLYAGSADKTGIRKRYAPEDIREELLGRLKVKDVEAFDREWKAFLAGLVVDAPEARLKRGLSAVRQLDPKRFEAAAEDLAAAAEAGLEDARLFWGRGILALVQSQDWAAAEADLRRAVDLQPLGAGFRHTLGQILAGRVSFGADSSEEVWELHGADERLEEARLHLGVAHELNRDNESYRKTYEEFLSALERHHQGATTSR